MICWIESVGPTDDLCVSDKPNLSVYCDVTIHKLSETPFGIFSIYVILTISYLRAQTIETSSLPTDSSRPLFEEIEIFSSILTAYLNCKCTVLNIRASYWGASSGFRLWAKFLREQKQLNSMILLSLVGRINVFLISSDEPSKQSDIYYNANLSIFFSDLIVRGEVRICPPRPSKYQY